MSQVCRDSPLRWKDGVGSGACGVGEVRLVWDVRCGECSVRCGVWGVGWGISGCGVILHYKSVHLSIREMQYFNDVMFFIEN